MDIEPRPCVLSLWDGTITTLFQFRDFLELVDFYMGYEAMNWLETHVNRLEEAAEYTTAKVETDIPGYEASLESNTRAFQDIQEEAAAIMEVLQGKRVDREKITHSVREIGRIIQNQI